MAILDALEPQLVRLRASYAKTPLPRFFSWWGRELVACLPQRWRASFAERLEVLLLDVQDGALVVQYQSGSRLTEMARLTLGGDAGEQRMAYDRLRAGIEAPQLRVFYCIPVGRTLRRTLSMPVAVEERLRSVLAFEMDRQTPFKADQVYFDYRVLGRDAAGKNLQVDLAVVPRAQLDAELSVATGLGIGLDGVDCWRDRNEGTRLGINLLPAERRARHKNMRLRFNLALGAAALLLLGVVMSQSVSNREAGLAAMIEAVSKTQNEAKQVTALRKTLGDTIDSANFLAQKRRSSVTMVELLDDLSKRLPDSTYLERVNLTDDNRLELQGLSDDAARLIELLQHSDIVTNPSFQGVIQPDPRVKKDRFNLLAQVKPKEEKKPATAAPAPAQNDAGGKADAPASGSP
jgi:general secretion pathway protein L